MSGSTPDNMNMAPWQGQSEQTLRGHQNYVKTSFFIVRYLYHFSYPRVVRGVGIFKAMLTLHFVVSNRLKTNFPQLRVGRKITTAVAASCAMPYAYYSFRGRKHHWAQYTLHTVQNLIEPGKPVYLLPSYYYYYLGT